ncbi:MAG: cytochrome [Herbinix sp.]|jgi:fatty-acid peroxygenase|nr:cytochrome [Herbinix sp.]
MIPRKKIPRDLCLDNTLKLLSEGYFFITRRCKKYHSDIFQTRLFGQKVVCLSGVEAAKLFYDNNRFSRKGAAPKRVQKTLFGEKGVQTLDGAEHQHRKMLFITVMSPDRTDQLIKLVKKQWQLKSKCWEKKEQIVLFDEVQILLCEAACRWTGIPIRPCEAKYRAQDFGKMIDAFGAAGPRYWQGKCARKRTEKWMEAIVDKVRCNQLAAPVGSALYEITWHRDLNGCLLPTEVAAVEIINVIRPIVAIATYITFGALALIEYPECVKKLRKKVPSYPLMFVQEVRRFYPFGPFVGARVRKDFIWKNYSFQKGTLVLLDLFGTNHDRRLWFLPNRFIPERFQNRKDTPFDLIPQGGGDAKEGNRCPGEAITIELMKASIKFLANHLDYDVPCQDLRYSYVRMPTLPKSRVILKNIRRIAATNK